MTTDEQFVEPAPSVDVSNVQLVVGARGLFVHLMAVQNGMALAEIGMTPAEAVQVAAALQLHAAKAQSLTSQKPNA